MKTGKCFRFIASIMVMVTVPLLSGAMIPTLGALVDSNNSFTEHTIAGDFDGAASVYATDMDDDGDVDVLGAAGYADDITWWENDGSENFTEHTIDGDFEGAQSVYATDVDDDEDIDVIGAAYEADDIIWWENDGSESFTGHVITDAFIGAWSVYAIDVDSDGDMDILGAAIIADAITWWENDGSENFTGHTVTGDFDGADSVYATDVDSDGDVDILGAAWGSMGGFPNAGIHWWENDGSENFTEHTIVDFLNFQNARSAYAIDMDGDGDVDILGACLWASFWDGIFWWENDGSENFTPHRVSSSIPVADAYATDIDSDGDIDVIGATAQANDFAWWENDGSENFTRHTLADNLLYARSVYATDVDGDGDVDVLGAARDADDITWWEQTVYSIYLPLILRNH